MKKYQVINRELVSDGINEFLESTLIKITISNEEETISKVFYIDEKIADIYIGDYVYFDGENIMLAE